MFPSLQYRIAKRPLKDMQMPFLKLFHDSISKQARLSDGAKILMMKKKSPNLNTVGWEISFSLLQLL